MPEPSRAERLLPCLLDRVTDEQPEAQREGSDRRVVSLRRYREGVRRDLESLLNASCHGESEEFSRFKQVADSVLNFGIPDLCGQTVSGLSMGDVQQQLRQAIIQYEPRIISSTLSVRVATVADRDSGHCVSFEITGQLWAMPAPDPLYYTTEVDLETGQFQIKDRAHG
ncbi:MAG: type VI secretion system baseplate subunit TssE [Planctomycetes bacterium]|nr:type VI secretion system baseplate subunit TssE [Planctomycetota bacterium]